MEIFQGAKSIVIQISIVMLIFLLFLDQMLGGQKSLSGNCLRGRPPVEESQIPVRDKTPSLLTFVHFFL